MSREVRSARRARISVVVPVFDEEAVLPELRQRLTTTLEKLTPDFEVLAVDDGSRDGSASLLDRFCEEDARFKCVHLSRNFGHQAAVTAGLAYSRGDLTCVMDADLQDPPEVLPALVEKWEEGFDVVYAVRRDRKEHPLKVKLYHLFYRIFARLSSVPMPLDAGDFSLLSRRVLDELNRLPERERFVRGLRAWVGFRQTGVKYEREARAGGRSKYGFLGLAKLAVNGIVSFSDRPLVSLMLFGLVVSAAAFIYGTGLLAYVFVFGGVVTGYASLMAGILFLSGIQLTAIGTVGIYLGLIFREVKARPTYVVESVRGFEESR